MPIAKALGRSDRGRRRTGSLAGGGILFLGLGLLTFSLGACSDPGKEEAARKADPEVPAPPQPAGHQRMVELLARVAEETADGNPYRGEAEAKIWQAKLKALPERPSAQRLEAILHLAEAEALEGREESVLNRLQGAYNTYSRLKPSVPEKALNLIRYRLAVAYFRRGETQNCCARFNADSCIMPIRGKGIHTNQTGSRNAIRYLGEILMTPNADRGLKQKSRWLLNLAYMTIGGYPSKVPQHHLIPPAVFASDEPWPKFVNVAPRLDLDTFNLAGGVIVDDFDGDNLLDVVSSTFDAEGMMRYFRNGGDGTFQERSREAGLTGLTGGLNMEQADYDNDGDLDILVLRGAWLQGAGRHPNSLLRNDGKGVFTDVTFAAGLAEPAYPTQTAAWSDYDQDGDLDLYVGNEQTGNISAPNQLFQNNGNGTFVDVGARAGVQNGRFTKGVTWGDYDNDGDPDLYVANLMSPNRLYRNNGDGTFTDVGPELKVTRPMAAFPTWFWDYDNDGNLDLFVAANRGQPDSLSSLVESYLGQPCDDELACIYRGDGKGGFVEVAAELGLDTLVLPMGCNFGDLDHDGFLDFYLGTGYPAYDALMPNLMFRNRGGQGFSDVTWEGGFGHLQKGHGIAFADFDHDGDQDIYVQMGGGATGDRFSDALFENPGFENNWIAVQLVGTRSNRCAIGARIRLVLEEEGRPGRSVYRHVNSGASFGANPLRQTIGIGKADSIARIEIWWPTSGITQRFEAVAANRMIRITEESDMIETVALPRFQFPDE
ncbi:MAG: CRTAC1 family protein [Roseibacillus sp.]|nr:CRTAC1 family protein [Roseibacillus sp.]